MLQTVEISGRTRPLAESRRRGQLFRERGWVPWLLFATDIAALELSVAAGFLVREALGVWLGFEPTLVAYNGIACGVLVLLPLHCLAQLYPGYQLPPVERLKRRISMTAAVFGILISWDYLVEGGAWPRGVLLITFVFALVMVPTIEAAVRSLLVRMNCWGAPVVIVGAGSSGREIARTLRDSPELGMVPVGFLDDEPSRHGSEIDGVPVLGPISSAAEAARIAKLAIISMDGMSRAELAALTYELPFPKFVLVPEFNGMRSLWVEAQDMAGMLTLEVKNNLLIRRARFLKNVLDYGVCIAVFICSLPLMALICLAIKLDSPGPILFTQDRFGHGQRRFKVIKFRTMRTGAESLETLLARDDVLRREYEMYHKLRNDPRITRVGRFLRSSTLDELPQLWNVLRGDMSLIGPRPYMPEELDDMAGAERVILEVPPGITGLWQISGRTELPFKQRLEMDIYYIRNWSLWLDLYILVRTVVAVTIGRGAH